MLSKSVINSIFLLFCLVNKTHQVPTLLYQRPNTMSFKYFNYCFSPTCSILIWLEASEFSTVCMVKSSSNLQPSAPCMWAKYWIFLASHLKSCLFIKITLFSDSLISGWNDFSSSIPLPSFNSSDIAYLSL
jgi:hypothetical protein